MDNHTTTPPPPPSAAAETAASETSAAEIAAAEIAADETAAAETAADEIAADETAADEIAAEIDAESTTIATPQSPENADGIKEEIDAAASDEMSSDGEQPPDADQPSNSPVFLRETDGEDEDDDDEGEEDEEPLPKKQKQLADLPEIEPNGTGMAADADAAGPSDVGKASSSKPVKKSKKKSKDVWTTTTRKGKKKTKHASNHNQGSANGPAEEKTLIAPIPRFMDRNDDSPELKICLSKVYKAEKVELSEDRLTAGSIKGYRMVRATRGVSDGAWYFEIKIVHLGESGHTRLGWTTDKGDLQAPVGYDGNSFGYRDIDGCKVHKAQREAYGEGGYKEGDVLGFYIHLPDGGSYVPNTPRMVLYKGQRYVCAPDSKEDPPKVVPGSEISFFKNGKYQGVAFTDLYGGHYYPAASMYTLPNQPNCVVKFNFGPDFENFPEDFGGRPAPKPMIEVPYQGYEGRVENGSPRNINRMWPMFKDSKIVRAADMVG